MGSGKNEKMKPAIVAGFRYTGLSIGEAALRMPKSPGSITGFMLNR